MITDQICQHNGKTTTTADLNDLIDYNIVYCLVLCFEVHNYR